MTHTRHHLLGTARAAAWLLLLLCGWMGTGGVLCHTDPGAASSAQAHAQHRTAAVPAHSCAACRWAQGMQTGSLAVCRVTLPLSALSPAAAPPVQSLSPRPIHRRSPRAPPLFPNNC